MSSVNDMAKDTRDLLSAKNVPDGFTPHINEQSPQLKWNSWHSLVFLFILTIFHTINISKARSSQDGASWDYLGLLETMILKGILFIF
jgi:hypothetical protein